MIKFLDLNALHEPIEHELIDTFKRVLDQSSFIGGDDLKAFEAEFAAFLGAKHCVGVGNGTDAIEIALEALGLPSGSEVLVPANSFIASSEAVTRSGLRVRFCDVTPGRYTIDPDDMERKINANTSAVIVVHLYGQMADMNRIMEIADRHGLKVIEDCAQSHGASIIMGGSERKGGTIGDLASFSFYPGKNLGALGDGGAVTTNNDELAKRVRMIANHGRLAKYDHQFEGRNSRLDGLQAALLRVKLKQLPRWNDQRRALAAIYAEDLKDIDGLELPHHVAHVTPVYHLYVVRTRQRDALKEHLKQHGVETGIHYPIALPKLQAYAYLNQAADVPFSCATDAELLSLPMGPHLTDVAVNLVSSLVRDFFKGKHH